MIKTKRLLLALLDTLCGCAFFAVGFAFALTAWHEQEWLYAVAALLPGFMGTVFASQALDTLTGE